MLEVFDAEWSFVLCGCRLLPGRYIDQHAEEFEAQMENGGTVEKLSYKLCHSICSAAGVTFRHPDDITAERVSQAKARGASGDGTKKAKKSKSGKGSKGSKGSKGPSADSAPRSEPGDVNSKTEL